MVFIKIMLVIICGVVAYQDFGNRAVLWILFPILAILFAVLHLNYNELEHFLFFSIVNILLITAILLVLWLYTKYIRNKAFLNVSFGLGDILFLYAFALGFPTVTFILLFSGSIIFSLLLFLLLKNKMRMHTVPLAGLMSLFLIAIVLIGFLPNTPSLYII